MTFLKPFLQEGEEIYLTTTGCSSMSIFEQLVMGWMVVYVKRSLFVFTNKRMLHIPTKTDFTYRNSIAEIAYSDCASIKQKGSRLIVEFADGTKEKFFYIATKERKKIRVLLNALTFGDYQAAAQGKVHLCPRCTQKLIKDHYQCQGCGLEFKNKEKAKKISLIFPGGGYFYTRHPFLGLGDAITETVPMLLVLVSFLEAVDSANYAGVIVVGILLVFEKMITIYDSNRFIKEFIPVGKEIGPVAQH